MKKWRKGGALLEIKYICAVHPPSAFSGSLIEIIILKLEIQREFSQV